MDKTISVIIPTLNEEKYIGNILANLGKQTYKTVEVIVVDGNSKDKTIDIVRKHNKVKIIRTRANIAHQRNIGAKKSKGDLLVFMDADIRINTYFLKKVNEIFEKDHIDIGCPIYLPNEKHLQSLILYGILNGIFFLVQRILPSGAGSCIIVRKKAYLKAKGFDPRFTFDDMHFLSKFKKTGKFRTLMLKVLVSNRRIKKLGFIHSLLIYSKLSWYFIRSDFKGANSIKYPFGQY